jgi:hypothetical protein
MDQRQLDALRYQACDAVGVWDVATEGKPDFYDLRTVPTILKNNAKPGEVSVNTGMDTVLYVLQLVKKKYGSNIAQAGFGTGFETSPL